MYPEMWWSERLRDPGMGKVVCIEELTLSLGESKKHFLVRKCEGEEERYEGEEEYRQRDVRVFGTW